MQSATSGLPLSVFDLRHRRLRKRDTKKETRARVSLFLSYLNTIDFRTPDLKITMCETTLQSLLRFLRIISRLKLQQPVIFRQHLHLTDGNGVEFCQTL